MNIIAHADSRNTRNILLFQKESNKKKKRKLDQNIKQIRNG